MEDQIDESPQARKDRIMKGFYNNAGLMRVLKNLSEGERYGNETSAALFSHHTYPHDEDYFEGDGILFYTGASWPEGDEWVHCDEWVILSYEESYHYLAEESKEYLKSAKDVMQAKQLIEKYLEDFKVRFLLSEN